MAALREEKVDAEKRVEAGLKNLHQKEEKITLLQVKLTLKTCEKCLCFKCFLPGSAGNCA